MATTPSSRQCLVLNMGLVEYGEAFAMQRSIADARERGSLPDVLILLEHPPVITLGRRANASNIVVIPEFLQREGVAVHRSTRGGDVTYHGPGQIVGYPLFNLRGLGLGVAKYVHGLESAIIELLAEYGLPATQDPNYIGVWVGDEKIAAIGVAVSRGISMHGFALNVDPNLSHFRLINPCGITDKGVTSMARLLGRSVTVEEVQPKLRDCISRTFAIDLVDAEPADIPVAGIPAPRR